MQRVLEREVDLDLEIAPALAALLLLLSPSAEIAEEPAEDVAEVEVAEVERRPAGRGTGRERRTKRYTVKIPAGVKDGSRIRLRGKGEAGYGGAEAGDLFVVTRVAASKVYTRRGDDLVVDLQVPFSDAALGATAEVPTPDGPVKVKIKAGTTDGTLLRVKGKGAPKLKGSGRGDVLARVKLTVPKKLNKKQRELFEQLKQAGA